MSGLVIFAMIMIGLNVIANRFSKVPAIKILESEDDNVH
jgi:hypothetical protein